MYFCKEKELRDLNQNNNAMKNYLLYLLISLFTFQVNAQNIGISANGATPNNSAMLDVDVSGLTTKKGLLIPKVTISQKSAMNPLPEAAQGLVVYQTDGVEGFYYNTSITTTPVWKYLTPSDNTGGWLINGNSAIDSTNDFIGTTDAKPIVFKTNNLSRMHLSSNGDLGIGTTTPKYELEVRGDSGFVYTRKNKESYNFSSSWGREPLDDNNKNVCAYPGLFIVTYSRNTGPTFFMKSDNGAIRGGVFTDSAAHTNSFAKASIAFGYAAKADGEYSFSAGAYSDGTGDNSVALGAYSIASGERSFAAQYGEASGFNSFAFYGKAKDTLAIALGFNEVNKSYGTAIGYGNVVDGRYGICIGNNVNSKNENAIAIGTSTRINSGCDVSKGLSNTISNSLMIGFNSDTATFFVGPSLGAGTTGNVGIGTIFPSAKLEVAGQIKITGGTPGAGKFLQSDANGLASWEALPVATITSWEQTGNSGTTAGTNFIGTIDAVSLVTKTSNVERMRILSTGNIGINTTTPDNLLDVNGKISITQSLNDEMVLINDDIWRHSEGNQDFGDGADHFIMASKEGANESAGIYGDGDHVTIWSAGDGAPGQSPAYLYILDEDNFSSADTDPFNNGALKAYITNAGIYQVSDKKKKKNLVKMENAIDRLSTLNGYTYEYKLQDCEIEKGQKPERSSGVIAQELELVLPEAVQTNDNGDKFVSYSAITPLLIEGINEQQKVIENQEIAINDLQVKLEEQQIFLQKLLADIEELKNK